jgi:DNA-binding protein HU-beta
MNKAEAERVVNTFFDTLRSQAGAGKRIEIRRFGTFETRRRTTKIGYNPYSKEMIAVPASERLHFKISTDLSKAMNGKKTA